MLRELYYYLTTPCTKAHRQLGYLSGAIALQARYHRVAPHWQPHLQHTQQLIIDAAQQCLNHDKVIVIGSGQLLDVPIKTLSEMFKQVILLDVIHLRSTRKQCMQYHNVTFVEYDISGLSEEILDYQPTRPLPQVKARLPIQAEESDLVISCNLLSQLTITPTQQILKHHTVDEDTLYNWQQSILQNHLQLLSSQKGRCCLITDCEHHYLDVKQQCLQQQDILFGVPLGKADKQWLWPIAPLGELSTRYQLQAVVRGYYDWPNHT